MKIKNILSFTLLALSISLFLGCSSKDMNISQNRYKLVRESRYALEDLYDQTSGAQAISEKAYAVLVFPSIVKGGFVVGAQYGEGVLFIRDEVRGYYSSVSGSYGLQAGLQKFGYALFFMKESDLAYLNRSGGWEVGVGPTITIMDEGKAASFTTTTARDGVYAFFFDQKGLMAGLGVQGTKITRVY